MWLKSSVKFLIATEISMICEYNRKSFRKFANSLNLFARYKKLEIRWEVSAETGLRHWSLHPKEDALFLLTFPEGEAVTNER